MSVLPLITHKSPEDTFAWSGGQSISAGRFLSDVAELRERLPSSKHVLNVCHDRYRFTVGLAAAMTSGKISLLLSTPTPAMTRYLLQFAPDAFCLTDDDACAIEFPQVKYLASSKQLDLSDQSFTIPQIDGEQLVAYVFTSGSTGSPIPHPKKWASLVRDTQAEAKACGLSDGRHYAVIGTVPPQHMYGFESTVLMVMQSANALVSDSSFFPTEICNVIKSVPRPRILVSTPIHFRSMSGSGTDIPPVDLLMSASAPLSSASAVSIEEKFNAPLLEIYGSTETGQIATRYPTKTKNWTLFPDVKLTQEGSACFASGGHVQGRIELQDVIDIIDEHHFILHGRTEDLINIAGKRNSLAHLNLQLTSIPGVVDGTFVPPEDIGEDFLSGGVARLAALVVAPSLTAEIILKALREKIEPAFLPRPIILLDALPRNATGKLPREVSKSLITSHILKEAKAKPPRDSGTARLYIAPDHPAFVGHFPGNPIVPGVVLLDEALQAIIKMTSLTSSCCQINTVKFLSPVRPNDRVSVQYTAQGIDASPLRLRFDITANNLKIATGVISVTK